MRVANTAPAATRAGGTMRTAPASRLERCPQSASASGAAAPTTAHAAPPAHTVMLHACVTSSCRIDGRRCSVSTECPIFVADQVRNRSPICHAQLKRASRVCKDDRPPHRRLPGWQSALRHAEMWHLTWEAGSPRMACPGPRGRPRPALHCAEALAAQG